VIFLGILTVLAVSLILYVVFGGADFGAGILEGLGPESLADEQEALITRAMGPVWEANHMWLILAVVILFNGFPFVYSFISTVFHVPLLVMLVGIILRGCSFTFRHYDPFHDKGSSLYTRVFACSSILTPFTLGVMAGAMTEEVMTDPFLKDTDSLTFTEVYINSWLSLFSLACGVFMLALCSLTAACFLFCEAGNKNLLQFYRRKARQFLIVVAAVALLVFLLSLGHEGRLAG